MASVNTKLYSLFNRLNLLKANIPLSHYRCSSNYNSPFLVDIGDVKVKYDVSKNPEEWKYVERTLPPLVVPDPIPKAKYPSEWRPQGENVQDLPYYISRTKNHMIPVYLTISHDGTKRTTTVRKVQGDIWLLGKHLKEFLQPQQVVPLRMQVNEFAGYIRIHGDHVNAVNYWLMQKNL